MNKIGKFALGIIGVGVGITIGTAIYMFKSGKSLKETKDILLENSKDIVEDSIENTKLVTDKVYDCAKDLIEDYKKRTNKEERDVL